MKKLLALLLVLVVCVGTLASCTVPSFLQPAVDFVNGILGNEPDNTTEVTIDDAATYLYNMYKDDEGKKTPNDFDVVGKVIIDGVSFDVTWTSDNEKVVIKESTKANFYTVDIPDANDAEFTYTLTATIKSGDASVVKTFTRVVPVVDNSGIATAPEAEVAYKLFFYQGNKQKTYYALNTIVSDKYIDTTEDPTLASDYYAEADGEGYKFYTMIDGAKKYVEAYLYDDGKTAEGTTKWSKRIRFSDNGTTWTYKADCNAWFTTIQDGPYVIGTYNTFTTVSISDGSFMTPSASGKSQFPLQLILSDYAEENGKVEGPVEHTCADANGDYACDTENCDKVLAPAANSTLTLEQATKLATALKGDYSTDKYFIVVTITEVYDAKYGNLYVSDATVDKFTVYGTYDATGANRYDAMENAPVAGDTVTIWGVIGAYNGTAQMKNGWFTDEAPETPETPDTPDTPATGDGIIFDLGANGDAAWADGEEVTAESLTFTSGNYTLTITNMTKVYASAFDAKGNSILKLGTGNTAATLTFVVPADVNSVIIYAGAYKTYADNATITVNGTQYTLTGMAGNGEYDAITVDTSSNKTVTLETVAVGSGKPRAAINTIVFSTTAGGSTTPDTPVTPDEPETPAGDLAVVDTPAVDTAYKFGMIQANVNNTIYYLLGGMDSYYLATTTDASAALDVYLEATTGGYYLYCYVNNTKTYINMVVNDTHVNGAYEANASTVYTYDATSKTLIASVDGEDYWFATRNDKTFTTMGPCKVSYEGFYGQFYGAATTEPETPVDPDPTPEPEPEQPDTPVDPEPTPDPEPEQPDTPAEPEQPADNAPAAGLYNATVLYTGTTLKYLNGLNHNNYSFRWAIGDNAAAATYELIKVDGGYNVKVTVNATGVSKYINIVPVESNGSIYVNAIAGDTAVSVWKWNADGKYLYVTVTDADSKNGDYTLMQTSNYENVEAKVVTTTGNIVSFVATTAHTHDYTIAATCTVAQSCVCGATTGETIPHVYGADSCTAIGKCECGASNPDGALLNHNYVNGACSACGAVEGATTPKYTLVTNAYDFTSGSYVIIASNTVAMGTYSSGWILTAAPTVSGNIVTDTANATWTLTVDGSSVSLQDANGAYIAPKSGNNNGIQNAEYDWAWVWNADGTVSFKGTGSDTTILASNTGSDNKFRAYKTTTVAGNAAGYPSTFYVYKLA